MQMKSEAQWPGASFSPAKGEISAQELGQRAAVGMELLLLISDALLFAPAS